MHPRRDDNEIQNAFEPDREPPVGMMKECRRFEADEENQKHYRRDAEDHHCKRKKADGKNHLAEMESRGSAHVEVEIGVMHVMKSPEERHHVIGPMPPPVGVIHQKKGRDDSSPSGEANPVQQPDMLILRPHPHRDWDWQHSETDDSESRNREHKIAHQPMERTKLLAAQRESPLQPEQDEKHASQQRPADIIDQRNFGHDWEHRLVCFLFLFLLVISLFGAVLE